MGVNSLDGARDCGCACPIPLTFVVAPGLCCVELENEGALKEGGLGIPALLPLSGAGVCGKFPGVGRRGVVCGNDIFRSRLYVVLRVVVVV